MLEFLMELLTVYSYCALYKISLRTFMSLFSVKCEREILYGNGSIYKHRSRYTLYKLSLH